LGKLLETVKNKEKIISNNGVLRSILQHDPHRQERIINANLQCRLLCGASRTKPHKCIKEKKEKAEERTGYEETISVLYIARQEIRIAYTGP
jgi:hypothetical protein